MTADHKTLIGTIDLTPSWVGILPLLLAALQDGSDTAKTAAQAELRRMAQLADLYKERT